MPILKSAAAPRFEIPGLTVTGLASPARGARETCVWRCSLPPGTQGTEHTVDREEIFVVLAGRATATLDGVASELAPGDTLVVPPHTRFSLGNPGRDALEAIAVLPVGGRACLPAGEPFTPPWAQ